MSWTPVSAPPAGGGEAVIAAASDGLFAYVVTSAGPGAVYRYNAVTDTYTALDPLAANYPYFYLSHIADYGGVPALLAFFNFTTTGFWATAVLQPTSGAWAYGLPPDPVGQRAFGAYGWHATTDAGETIVAGGYVSGVPTDDVRLYDAQLDGWSSLSPLPAPLGTCAGAWLGSEFHVIGDDSAPAHYVWDGAAWTTLAVPPVDAGTTNTPAVVALDATHLLVAGGIGHEAWLYDSVALTWTQLDDLPFDGAGSGALTGLGPVVWSGAGAGALYTPALRGPLRPEPYVARLTAELVPLSGIASPGTPLDVTATSPEVHAMLSDAGAASITFQNDDPVLASIHSPNSLINFFVDGVCALTMWCEVFDRNDTATDEEADETTTWSGRGHAARIFDCAVLYPSMGIDRYPIEEERHFNWTSQAYDDSGWIGASMIELVGDAKASGAAPWPIPWADDFPLDSAEILWGSYVTPTTAAVGNVYGRQRFTTTYTGPHALYVTADNAGEFYIDGALIISHDEIVRNAHINVELTAGDHLLCWAGRNAPQVPGYDNPAGIAWVLYIPGYPPEVVTYSIAADTLIADYPVDPPGMTPGRAIRAVLYEWILRMAASDPTSPLLALTATFDDDVDSHGVPWPVVADIAASPGDTVLSFLVALSETYIDWWLEPGTWNLHAYVKDGLMDIPGVSYTTGVNVATLGTKGET